MNGEVDKNEEVEEEFSKISVLRDTNFLSQIRERSCNIL